MFLDPELHRTFFDSIKRRCRRRGIKALIGENYDLWEMHGPHYPNMPYNVFTGPALDLADNTEGYIVLYPRRAYWLDSSIPDWKRTDPNCEIFVIHPKKKSAEKRLGPCLPPQR